MRSCTISDRNIFIRSDGQAVLYLRKFFNVSFRNIPNFVGTFFQITHPKTIGYLLNKLRREVLNDNCILLDNFFKPNVIFSLKVHPILSRLHFSCLIRMICHLSDISLIAFLYIFIGQQPYSRYVLKPLSGFLIHLHFLPNLTVPGLPHSWP